MTFFKKVQTMQSKLIVRELSSNEIQAISGGAYVCASGGGCSNGSSETVVQKTEPGDPCKVHVKS